MLMAKIEFKKRSPQSTRIAAWSTAIAVATTLGFIATSVRVLQLQFAPSERLQIAISDGTSHRSALVRRGDLTDRRGRLLATTSTGFRAFLDPAVADDPEQLGLRLQESIGVSNDEVNALLKGRLSRRYIPLPSILQDWQVEQLRAQPVPGVGIEQVPIRHYPHGDGGAPLVGMVGFEHTGLSGMEHAMEGDLEPVSGHIRMVRDATRRTMWLPPDGFDPGRDGESIRLSFDLYLQRIAEARLHEAVETHGAAGGRSVIIDPHTGELLAAAAVSRDDAESPARLRRNRCVTDPYEPGSTFKPFVWATATEEGIAHPQEVLKTPSSNPYRTSFGRSIRDAHPRGSSTWRQTLVHSLNSGMAIVAERLSHADMRKAIQKFGFGHTTGCGIPGETNGIMTSLKQWSAYTQTSVSMGHEIAVTPVQMARAFCVFASDGLLPPVSVRAIDDKEDVLTVRTLDPATAAIARETMRAVMTEGTGRRVQSEHYSMFGKSGTAQLPKETGGGYYEDRYISSFIAGAPVDSPRVVILCVIDDPDRSLGHWYGSSTAGPVVRDLIDRTLPYLGVPSDTELAIGH